MLVILNIELLLIYYFVIILLAHSFFFSGGCVYILLFDISLDPERIIEDNKLLYWFHFLHTQVGTDAK